MKRAKPRHPDPTGLGAPCCGRHDVWEQAWGGPSGSCDRGLSGAHLVYKWVYGCQIHHQIEGDLGVTGTRYCPGRCRWSREGKVARVDRTGCREQTCYCHDGGLWVPGAFPDGSCCFCGCRWAE